VFDLFRQITAGYSPDLYRAVRDEPRRNGNGEIVRDEGQIIH
jgi:hypothetical protein